MNILQITNTACTDSNQSTGVNRMVTQLSNCLANDYGNVFFMLFLLKGNARSPLCSNRPFTSQILLTRRL